MRCSFISAVERLNDPDEVLPTKRFLPMMSNSDAGKELNTDELSFRSKRLPEKETVKGLGVSLMCQQSLAALSVLIFIALAQVNNQPAQHLLWPAFWLFVCLFIFNTYFSVSYYYMVHTQSCIIMTKAVILTAFSVTYVLTVMEVILPPYLKAIMMSYSISLLFDIKRVRTVHDWCRGGCVLSTLLLGFGCNQWEWLQDGLLVSLFQVHGFI